MTLPALEDLYEVIDATWPALKITQVGPIVLREGAGGGSRVSAATVNGEPTKIVLDEAETQMDRMGQVRLFMVRTGENALDNMLECRGYQVKDPVWIYAAPLASLTTERPPPVTTFQTWPMLAAQKEIWAEGGIGPERWSVMDRGYDPKVTILGRTDDHPAGTVYVAKFGQIAMLHALEIQPKYRRHGLGRNLTRAAACWAQEQDAEYLSLLATKANEGANRLYSSLGMTIVGQYHYRIQKGGKN